MKRLILLALLTTSAARSQTYTADYKASSLTGNPTTWTDSSGNGYTLTSVGSPTWVASAINSQPAVTLNGTSQYFTAATAIPLSTSAPQTIYMEVKINSLSGKSTFISSDTFDGSGGGTLTFYVSPSGYLGADYQYAAGFGTSSGKILAGTWHELARTFNPSTQTISYYIDGTLSGTATSSNTITKGITRVGTNWSNSFAPVELSNVSIAEIAIEPTAYDSAVHSYFLSTYGGPTAVQPTSIALSPTTARISTTSGSNTQAYTCTTNLGTACTSPTYTSSNTSVATISGATATAIAPGTVTITGTANGYSATASLTGFSAATVPTSVNIAPQGAVIQQGTSTTFTVTCTYTAHATDDCTYAGGATWKASNPSSMSVTSSGVATWTGAASGDQDYADVVVTAGGVSDLAGIIAQNPADTFYMYFSPDFREFADQQSGAIQPLNIQVGSYTVVGTGVCRNTPSPGYDTCNPASMTCTWVSSDTSKATVNRYGVVHAVAAGPVTITCNRAGTGVYGSSADGSWQSPGNYINLTITNVVPTTPTTWYVQPSGGTLYSTANPSGQCNGKSASNYPGSGTNQSCAVNQLRSLWADGVTSGQMKWVISGGDTVLVTPKSGGYDVGGASPQIPNCNGGDDHCYMPPLPSGTAAQHTRLLGANYASCDGPAGTQGPLKSALTQLNVSWSARTAINVKDSQYVDVKCFEITDQSQCGGYNFGCNGNYGHHGVWMSNLTSYIYVSDLFIHGLVDDGLFGTSGGPDASGNPTVNFDRIWIRANGANGSGINMDDSPWSSGNFAQAGGMSLTNSMTEFSSCLEEYPIVHTYPFIECRDQSEGGYGDGFGTGSTTGNWVFDHDVWRFNYQDGLDLLHSGMQKLSVTNSQSYANDGQQYKVGNAINVVFSGNTTVGNCRRILQTVGDEPASAVVANTTTVMTGISGLALTYTAGKVTIGGTVYSYPGLVVNLAPNATTWIYVDATSHTITSNTTGWPGLGEAQIAIVPTGASGIVLAGGYTDPMTVYGVFYMKNYLYTACRAGGNSIALQYTDYGSYVFNANSFVEIGYGMLQYNCAAGWDTCSDETLTLQNNIFLGYTGPNYNVGQLGSALYSQPNHIAGDLPPNGYNTRDHNLFYGLNVGANGSTLPTELTTDPLFTGEPSPSTAITDANEPTLDNFNFALASGSPAIGTGGAGESPAVDLNGSTRATPPSMGALEYLSASPTGLSITPATLAVVAGGATGTLHCVESFADGSTLDRSTAATWTSSSPGVATVTGGLVSGVTAGAATISCAYGGLTLGNTAAVTVSSPAGATATPHCGGNLTRRGNLTSR